MFTIFNLIINKFNHKINENFMDNKGAFLDRNDDYIFLFEGYLYPDIYYEKVT